MSDTQKIRYATVRGFHITEREVAAYLPSNYEVTSVQDDAVLIKGRDRAGWTLDDYVIPRLASGNQFATEVDTGGLEPCPHNRESNNPMWQSKKETTQGLVEDYDALR